MNTLKTYHIYYLPNAVRTYYSGDNEKYPPITVKGKVGYSGQSIEDRKARNEYTDKLDITGHRVLLRNIKTKKEAKRLEKILQKTYRCVEPSAYHMFGRADSEELKKIKSEAMKNANRTTQVCPVCKKEGATALMTRYHGKEGEKCNKNYINKKRVP
jgi:hypothetical protein